MDDLHERIRTVREQLGMNQAKFAQAVGVTPSAVCQWERADSPTYPSRDNIKRIAEVRGIDVQSLLFADLSAFRPVAVSE